MRIKVEHEIPYSADRPLECVGDGDFWGRTVCPYHKLRDRTHGRKAPIERRVPKCALFDEWLSGEYKRCGKCLAAINAVKEDTTNDCTV